MGWWTDILGPPRRPGSLLESDFGAKRTFTRWRALKNGGGSENVGRVGFERNRKGFEGEAFVRKIQRLDSQPRTLNYFTFGLKTLHKD